MGLIIEVFWAVLMVGMPVAAFTLAMVWFALQRGYLQESLDAKALRLEIKTLSKNNKKIRKEGGKVPNQHPLQKKWMKFGGGFYGIVAFFTYIVVEVIEITTMIANFGGFVDFLKQLDIGIIIEILVEALTNFITAMVWPLYWMDRIETDQTWIWFVIAYAGYWLGIRLAQVLVQRRSKAEI